MSIKEKASRAMARFLVRYRGLLLVVILALLVPAVFGLMRLRMDSSNESFMPAHDPVTVNNDRFKEIFGSEEFFFILVETDNIWTPDNLGALDDLAADIEQNLPFVDEVMTLSTADVMTEEDGFLVIDTMRDAGLPQTEEEIAAWRTKLEASVLYKGRILSDNPGEAGILISLKPLPDTVWARVEKGYSPFSKKYASREKAILADDVAAEPGPEGTWTEMVDIRKPIAATLLTLIEEHNRDGFHLTATGLPVIDRGVDALTGTETGFFGLLSLLAAALILFILYRDLRSVTAPLFVFLITTVLLFGLMGWLKMTISIMTIVLVPLLLVISVGYSVHIMNGTKRFLSAGFALRKEAVEESLTANLWPCFLSAATTAGGFLSFLFVPMKPIRELGFQCGTGALLTFVLAMILIPLFYIPGRVRSLSLSVREGSAEKTRIRWTRWNDFLFRNRILFGIVFGLAAVLSVIGMTRLKPSAEMLGMIGGRAPFVKDTWHVSDRLGGAYSAEFLIVLPEAEAGRDPAILKTLNEAGKLALQQPDVKITFSLADMVTELDRVLGSGGTVPDDRESVAQYLLLYEMSGGESLSSWSDLDYRTIRLSVILGGRSGGFDTLEPVVGGYLRENLPPGTVVTMTGDVPVMTRMMNLIVEGQIFSCLAALGFIGLLLILVLRSLRLGLTAVVPNIFPVVTTVGLMGLFGWSIDFVTVMVAPMLIGIAVDDTIHFFIHYKAHRRPGATPQEISGETFRNIGNSLVFTSIILAGGFVLFSFSRMSSLQHMGILSAAGIASALFADLILSPLLIALFYRKRKTRPSAGDTNLKEEIV